MLSFAFTSLLGAVLVAFASVLGVLTAAPAFTSPLGVALTPAPAFASLPGVVLVVAVALPVWP